MEYTNYQLIFHGFGVHIERQQSNRIEGLNADPSHVAPFTAETTAIQLEMENLLINGTWYQILIQENTES